MSGKKRPYLEQPFYVGLNVAGYELGFLANLRQQKAPSSTGEHISLD
jgi:hypothetical protein